MSALADSIRSRIADDAAAVADDYRAMIRDAADGKVDTEAAAAWFLANPKYNLEDFDREVNAIIAARELAEERRQAAAKLKNFDAKGAERAVAAAERELTKLDADREAWLAKFIERRTAAEQSLAAAREAADEPERLTHFLTRTAPAEKRERLAALPEAIRTTANRITVLRSQTESYERIASQRTLESGEFVRLERSGARFESGVVNADKSFAQRKLDAIRGEIAGAEFALKAYREELETLPAELLVP